MSLGLKERGKPYHYRKGPELLTAFLSATILSFLLQPWGFPDDLSRRKSSVLSVVLTALFPPGKEKELDVSGLALGLFLMASSAEATLHPIYQLLREGRTMEAPMEERGAQG